MLELFYRIAGGIGHLFRRITGIGSAFLHTSFGLAIRYLQWPIATAVIVAAILFSEKGIPLWNIPDWTGFYIKVSSFILAAFTALSAMTKDDLIEPKTKKLTRAGRWRCMWLLIATFLGIVGSKIETEKAARQSQALLSAGNKATTAATTAKDKLIEVSQTVDRASEDIKSNLHETRRAQFSFAATDVLDFSTRVFISADAPIASHFYKRFKAAHLETGFNGGPLSVQPEEGPKTEIPEEKELSELRGFYLRTMRIRDNRAKQQTSIGSESYDNSVLHDAGWSMTLEIPCDKAIIEVYGRVKHQPGMVALGCGGRIQQGHGWHPTSIDDSLSSYIDFDNAFAEVFVRPEFKKALESGFVRVETKWEHVNKSNLPRQLPDMEASFEKRGCESGRGGFSAAPETCLSGKIRLVRSWPWRLSP